VSNTKLNVYFALYVVVMIIGVVVLNNKRTVNTQTLTFGKCYKFRKDGDVTFKLQLYGKIDELDKTFQKIEGENITVTVVTKHSQNTALEVSCD
jgi:hypothetical protein